MRSRPNRNKSKKQFKSRARKTHRMNTRNVIRGGTRL